MRNPDLHKAIQVATELLASQRIIRPIFNIEKLDFGDRTILFDTIQNYARITNIPINIMLHDRRSPIKDGLILHKPNTDTYVVLYNEKIGKPERIRWTLAHEVGHVLLGHNSEEDSEEVEADTFAAQLLIPWFTLKMMSNIRKPSANYISQSFGVSLTAANNRILDMKRIFRIPSEFDKKIYDKQKKHLKDESRKPLPIEILDAVIVASNR